MRSKYPLAHRQLQPFTAGRNVATQGRQGGRVFAGGQCPFQTSYSRRMSAHQGRDVGL